RPVSLSHGVEVAEVVSPEVALIQIDFGHYHFAPLLSFGDGLAGVVVDGRERPIALHIGISAADQINVIFTGASLRQEWIAAPHRPGDHLGPGIRQFTSHFREKAIVADHHADLAEFRIEDRIILAGRHAPLNFPVGQAYFAILANELAIRIEEYGSIVN